MASAKATPFVLLAMFFLLASSAAAGGFFGWIPWFGGRQPSGGDGAGFSGGWGAGGVGPGGNGGVGGAGFSGGWGAGGVGPGGGFARRGVVQPSMVCGEGRCNNMRLTCPSWCFNSYSYSGKNGAGGGGGGGCTFDCTNSCQAHC
jgi:hypothetical protein